MSSCRRLFAFVFVTGLLAAPASASAEDALAPLGSTATIEETVAAETAPAVSIGSDKEDYAPSELVTLTGTGWQPGENVAISVVADGSDEPFQHGATLTADAGGSIVHSFNLPEWYVPLYHVTATGELSGVATASFTDALSQYRQATTAEAASTCANPGNALASDDQRATCERTLGTAEFVELSGFGLQNPVVPSTATNIGFQVEVEGLRSGGDRAAAVSLSPDNGTTFTAPQNTTPAFNSSTDQTRTTTAPDGTTGRCQTFGRVWTYAELANFRVRVATGGGTSATDFLDIDRVRVRVCYDGVNIVDAAVSSRTTAFASPSGIVRGALSVQLAGQDAASTPDWKGTTVQFGSGPETCIPGSASHPDRTDAGGPFNANFDMTAPAARGVYDVKYRVYDNDACTGSPLHAEPFTLPGGLTVDIFGDSFGRDPAVNNYTANSWNDGDGVGTNCSKQSQPVPPGIITPDAYLRLLNCTQTRSNINTAGFGEVHLKYRWGQATDEAVPNGLVVEWKPSSEGTWRSVESHALANSALTIPNSHDEDLGSDAEDTSIDIRFTGPPTGTGAADSAAVDDVVVTGVPAVAVSGAKTDENAVGLPGWTIKAYADDGANGGTASDGVLQAGEVTPGPDDTDDTDADGDYSLQLIPGDYVVCEEQETGWAQMAPSNAKCAAVDADAPGGHAVTVVASTPVTGQDFVNFEFGTLSGSKFEDVNRDELWDPDGVDSGDAGDDEIALSGWTIEAYVPDGTGQATGSPVASDTTAGDGSYELKVPAGSYVICEQIQPGWTQSTPASPNKTCGDIAGAAPGGHAATVAEGGSVGDKDFGNYRSGEVNGFKVDDQNRDAVLDRDGPDDDLDTAADNEPILGGWTIAAYAADSNGDAIAGTPVDTDVTDVKGFYELTLPVGDWVICEQLQTGWEQSAPDPADEECAAISGAGPGGHFVQIAQGDLEEDLDFGNYRTATVTVNKAYSDGTTTTPVTVKLECTSGTVDPATDTAAPGSPAEFTVDGFADGATCDVTEVDSPPGWTPDTDDCQDIALTVGGTPQCTVTNVKDVSIVTAGGCTFDRMSDRSGSQFPLIFTPDMGYYKLSSSNPGQFFLNVAYEAAAPGEQIKISIPFPFVMAGTNAIKVHSDVTVTENNGKTCYAPSGSLLSQEDDQITWNYSTANFGDTQDIYVTAPESGLVFVRIHMSYDLKGRAKGCTKYGSTAPHEARDCTAPRAGFDIGNAPTVGYEQYEFSFTGTNDDGGGTVESYNEFKKNPGIGGLVLAANSLTPFVNAKADIYQGTKKVATVYTDTDGWYMWTYKYTGKATTFTVKLPNNGNASQSATLKSNGYLNIPFTLP